MEGVTAAVEREDPEICEGDHPAEMDRKIVFQGGDESYGGAKKEEMLPDEANDSPQELKIQAKRTEETESPMRTAAGGLRSEGKGNLERGQDRAGTDAAEGEFSREGTALAVQLKRLDRAAFSAPGAGGDRAGQPVSLTASEGGAVLSGAVGGSWRAGVSRPDAAGALEWAEQADRAFRRDGRRYDGGFYLF